MNEFVPNAAFYFAATGISPLTNDISPNGDARPTSESIRQKILVQVKGGDVKRNDISTLLGDVNNQKFVGGILITPEKPTKPMREEAADAGRYESELWHKTDYPKIQILTIEGLLSGQERVAAPPQENPFAQPKKISPKVSALPAFSQGCNHIFPPYSVTVLRWSKN